MKTNGNIEPSEVIAWFRAKAADFNRIADTLESTFSGGGKPMPTAQRQIAPAHEITAEQIKKVVSEVAARAGTIAEKLNTTRECVLEVIQNNPGQFEFVGKGWIKLK